MSVGWLFSSLASGFPWSSRIWTFTPPVSDRVGRPGLHGRRDILDTERAASPHTGLCARAVRRTEFQFKKKTPDRRFLVGSHIENACIFVFCSNFEGWHKCPQRPLRTNCLSDLKNMSQKTIVCPLSCVLIADLVALNWTFLLFGY